MTSTLHDLIFDHPYGKLTFWAFRYTCIESYMGVQASYFNFHYAADP